jgi:hypothetical protein
MKNSIKFPTKQEVPQWQIDKWLVDIELSDMKNHVDAKKIDMACREALRNWPKDLEKSPVTIRSQAYKILTKTKVSETIVPMPEYAPHDIDEKASRPWNDR